MFILVPRESESGRSPFRGRTLDHDIGDLESGMVGGVTKVHHNQANFDLHPVNDLFCESIFGRRI